jgi:hypothetical protein
LTVVCLGVVHIRIQLAEAAVLWACVPAHARCILRTLANGTPRTKPTSSTSRTESTYRRRETNIQVNRGERRGGGASVGGVRFRTHNLCTTDLLLLWIFLLPRVCLSLMAVSLTTRARKALRRNNETMLAAGQMNKARPAVIHLEPNVADAPNPPALPFLRDIAQIFSCIKRGWEIDKPQFRNKLWISQMHSTNEGQDFWRQGKTFKPLD